MEVITVDEGAVPGSVILLRLWKMELNDSCKRPSVRENYITFLNN